MTKLTPKEEFDRLSQRYGNMPVCRSFQYGTAGKSISWNEFDRTIIELWERKFDTKFDEKSTLEFTFSTEGIKRDGNRINQDGWVLDKFRENPVALWCHDQTDEPVGRSPAQWLSHTGTLRSLRGLIQFTPENVNPRGARVERQYREGFLNAVSISWNPIEVDEIPDDEMEHRFHGGLDFLRNEALEISACPVPADPEALMKRIQSGQLDAEEMRLVTPRELITEKGPTGVFYIEGRQFDHEPKVFVDLKTNKEVETERSEGPDEVPIPILLTPEQIATLEELRAEGIRLAAVETVKPIDPASVVHLANHLFVQVADVADARSEAGYSYTFDAPADYLPGAFPGFEATTDVTYRFCLFIEKEPTPVVRQSGPVPFEAHKYSDKGEPWFPVEARRRLLEWATKDDQVGFEQYRKGFGWSEESAIMTARFCHHDVHKDGLVTNWTGLNQAAQRVMRRDADIPEEDYLAIEEHLRSEFNLFSEKAPFDRHLGKLYAQIHRDLRECRTLEETEELRSSADEIARRLFGTACRTPEPWEIRSPGSWSSDGSFDFFLNILEENIRELVLDPEELEVRLAVAANQLRSTECPVTLTRKVDPVVPEVDVFAGIEERVNRIVGKRTSLVDVVSRLETKLGSNKTDTIKEESLIDRLARRVEEKFSGSPTE